MITAISIFVALLLIMFLWLILGELTFTFDTKNHIYSIGLFSILKGSVKSRHQTLYLRIEAPFYYRNFDLESTIFSLTKDSKTSAEQNKIKVKKSKTGFLKRRMRNRFLRVLKTFKIDKCDIDIDTNDSALNGQLYPLTWALSKLGYPVHINFIGKQDVTIVIKNRLARIIKAILI